VFLWIAFNAAYATEIDDAYKESEQVTFKGFLQKLLKLDGKGRFERLVWDEFSGNIRVLLDNHFVFYDFWSFHNGHLEEEQWKERFAKANAGAKRALEQRQTDCVEHRIGPNLCPSESANAWRGHLEQLGQSGSGAGLR
jgi:hypothetical protein